MNKQISSRLEDAITVFGRFLRQAGYSVGSGEIMQAVQAVNYIKIEKREDFRQALKTCLLSNYKLIPLFDQLFEIYWRNPEKIEHVSNILKRLNEPRIDFEKKNLIKENIEDIFKKQFSETNVPNQESDKSDKVNIHLYSPFEHLKNKRFDHYSDEELEEAKKFINKRKWELPKRKLRRLKSGRFGNKLDIRNTIRNNIFPSQDFVQLSWKKPKLKARPLIVLMDISGSMDHYTRILMHFIHAINSIGEKVEAFTFGTRLTRITKHLKKKSVNDSIEIINELVKDWSGGTKIGETIQQFNYQWARRVLGNGAVVLVITDGWDTGNIKLLGQEFDRLHRSCYRLIWLNPNLGYQDFEPITKGVQEIIQYADDFLPIHSLKCLDDLGNVLSSLHHSKSTKALA